MRKSFGILLVLFVIVTVNAQKKPQERKIDTVKTEVVEVVTKYNPKIADAKKINTSPSTTLFDKSKKKELEYTISSVPVASTFIPKTGVVKGIDVGVKERIYKNYLALGYGNFATPFVETYLEHSTNYDNQFGVLARYMSSNENINETLLDSQYSNFNAGLFYKQEERYFDWKVALNSERNQYNWYGLPVNSFSETTINSINEQQNYNYFQVLGDFNFIDSKLEYSRIRAAYFTDSFNSKEYLINLNTKLNLPLNTLIASLNDISIETGLEYLNGQFITNYAETSALNYSIITAKIRPTYQAIFQGFTINAGVKTYVALDTENRENNFYLFPDVSIEKVILKNQLTIYGGVLGDLHTNTYKQFTEQNPFVSPTLSIKQTAETSNFFVGLNGLLSKDFSFNLKGSLRNEENKPLFLRNNSKSDGVSGMLNGNSLKGYEFGNSFAIYYDDVKTTTVLAELQYNFNKNIGLSAHLQYDNYTVTTAFSDWNLPSFQGSLTGDYKNDKWFASSTVFYVGERNDALFSGSFPATINQVQVVNSFVDLNINGGYHFNDSFSAFLKMNNILNTEYQRFANFETQGFQVLGGITYKFDF